MLKISSSNAKNIIIKYAVKIAVTSIISVSVLSLFFAFIILKLDLPLEYGEFFSVAICAISSFFISYISISGFKSNQLVLAIISTAPLLIYSLINFCFNGNNLILLIVKVILIVILSFLSAYIKAKKK